MMRRVHRVCFHIGSRPIYWYGVMMALGFLSGVWTWILLGRRDGRNSGFCSDLGVWIMLSGIAGARVAYVAASFGYYRQHLLEIVRVDQGGLIFYGGFLAAGAAIVLFARLHRESLTGLLDLVITGVPVAHALGRVGCFLNGCCYGAPSGVPWAVRLEGVARHPVQLYAAALNLAIYALLIVLYRRTPRRNGDVLTAYLLTYPVVRYSLEFLRGDPRTQWGPLNTAQWVSVALLAVGGVLLATRGKRSDAARRDSGGEG